MWGEAVGQLGGAAAILNRGLVVVRSRRSALVAQRGWRVSASTKLRANSDQSPEVCANLFDLGKSPTLSIKANKTNTFFFGGDVRLNNEIRDSAGELMYSHGVRRKAYNFLRDVEGFTIVNGRVPDYKTRLHTTRFCLAPTGAGWGIRIVEVIMGGCIPVVIADNVTQIFEELLPYDTFTVRVAEKDIEKLPEILNRITPEKEQEMRRELLCAWEHFTWSSVHGSLAGESGDHDAFNTVIHLLRRRLQARNNGTGLPAAEPARAASACNVMPPGSSTQWDLCAMTGEKSCKGHPMWFWVGPATKNWPVGSAAAVSRPGWAEFFLKSPASSQRAAGIFQFPKPHPAESHKMPRMHLIRRGFDVSSGMPH
ncbi:hypothetical protein CYMTET_27689 [Cymbomonas tetramitiformis]|uniref:Exostosin GT47 domain-containing protein n=1 Tax=Cymbomonas tetramitiformis TaxID=36881 RepID=A0AAE0KWN9_9CHLO|nr:hypothetical protein CYMTET_27689 [Cymbomonas tetramitiformis]